ncbi:MAG: GTPase [Planctomycetota bacterium]
MVQINFARKEVNCKIVYYGPGLSGKTTNLEKVHELAPKGATGDLTSISTDGERTLYFDFLPFDLGEIAGLRVKLQLYTVPGQGYYDRVRKLVLQGADGVVFVADSSPDRQEDNVDSLKNLETNLRGYKVELKDLPHAMQWNKRDLPGVMSKEQMESTLNPYSAPSYEAVAFKGDGVLQTLKAISKLVIEKLHRDFENQSQARASSAVVPAGAVRAAAPIPMGPVAAAPMAPVAAAAPAAPVPMAPAAVAPPAPAADPRKTPRPPLPAVLTPAQQAPAPRAEAPAPFSSPPRRSAAAGPVWSGGSDVPAPSGNKGMLIAVAVVILVVIGAAVAVIMSLS